MEGGALHINSSMTIGGVPYGQSFLTVTRGRSARISLRGADDTLHMLALAAPAATANARQSAKGHPCISPWRRPATIVSPDPVALTAVICGGTAAQTASAVAAMHG